MLAIWFNATIKKPEWIADPSSFFLCHLLYLAPTEIQINLPLPTFNSIRL
jgi:hypothetical protein